MQCLNNMKLVSITNFLTYVKSRFLPIQPLNSGHSADLPSHCLPSLGSHTNKTKPLVGSNSAIPSQRANDNQQPRDMNPILRQNQINAPPVIPEDKSNSATLRVRKTIILRS